MESSNSLTPKSPSNPKVLSSPSKNSRRLSNSKAQSVNFVSDIGESLLAECRRLHAELVSLQSQHDSLSLEHKDLESKYESMVDNDVKLKDENWELEVKLQELQDNMEKSELERQKWDRERTKWKKIQDEMELLKEKEGKLEEGIEKADKEKDELSKINRQLRKELTDIEDELENARSVTTPTLDTPKIPLISAVAPPSTDIDEDKKSMDFKTPTNSPPGSPTRTPSRHTTLESETMKTSLNYAHRTIGNLRALLGREKTEKQELQRLVSQLQESAESNGSNKRDRKLASKSSRNTIYSSDPHTRSSRRIDSIISIDSTTSDASEFQSAVEDDLPSSAHLNLSPDHYQSSLEDGFITATDGDLTETEPEDSNYSDDDVYTASHSQPNFGGFVIKQHATDSTPTNDQSLAPGYIDMQSTPVVKSSPQFKKLSSNSPINDVELENLARQRGFILLDESEYTRLTVKPEDEVRLNKMEYENILNKSNDLSPEQIILQAKSLGLAAIPLYEYEDLIKKSEEYNEKPEDFVKNSAASLGLIAVPTVEHEKLLKNLDETKALLEKTQDPTPEELSVKAQKLNLVTISSTEYQNLLEKLANDKEQLTNIDNPTWITTKAKEHDLTVLPSKEYESLLKTADDGKQILKTQTDPTYLSQKARDIGFVTIPVSEHEALLKAINEPSKEITTDRSATLVPILTSTDTPSKFNQSQIIKGAESLGMIAIGKTAYDALKSKSNENITKERLYELADRYNATLIEIDELKELKKQAYEPTMDQLNERAKRLGLSIINTSSLKTLESKADSSAIDIDAELDSRGLVAVSSDHLKKLEHISSNPTKEDLGTHAALLGMAVVSVEDLKKLHKQAEDPSVEDLQHLSSKLGMAVISQTELNLLERRAKEPTISDLNEMAIKHNYVVIDSEEWGEVNKKINDPSPVEISTMARSIGMVAIPQDEYDTLEKNAYEPERDEVIKQCRKVGLAGITVEEFNDLTRKVSQPSKPELELWAKKVNLVVIPREQFSELNDKASKLEKLLPSDGDIKNKQPGSVLARKEHFEGIIRKSALTESSSHGEKVIDSMRSLGYVPVSSEEYKRLVDNQKEYVPTKRDIVRSAKEFGLVAVAADEYKYLLRKNNHIDTRTNSVVSWDEARSESPFSLAPTPVQAEHSRTTPLPETFHVNADSGSTSAGLETVPIEYLSSLRRMVETPTKEDVAVIARRAGLNFSEEGTPQLSRSGTPFLRNDTPVVDGLIITRDIQNKVADFEKLVAEDASSSSLDKSAVENIEPLTPGPTSDAIATGITTEQGNATFFHEVEEQERLLEERKKAMDENSLLVDELQRIKGDYAQSLELKTKQVEDSMTEISRLKSQDGIKEVAKSLGLTVITQEEYDSLLSKSSSVLPVPVVLPISESKSIETSQKDFPTSDSLVSKAISVPEQSPKEILQPTPESISKEAEAFGLKVLDAEEYHDLVVKSNYTPPAITPELIYNEAEHLGLTVLEHKEYDDLVAQTKITPTAESVAKDAESFGFMVLAKDEYDDIVIRANYEPPVPEITPEGIISDADSVGLKVVTKQEYDELIEKSNPSIANLKNSAAAYGLALLSEDDYNAIANKPVDLKVLADEQGLILLTPEELKKLQEKSVSVLPPVPVPVPISTGDHKTIVKDISSSDIANEIESRGMVMIPRTELLSLREPVPIEGLESRANELGLVLLSANELAALKNHSKINEETVRSYAESVGLKLVDIEEWNELKKKEVELKGIELEVSIFSKRILFIFFLN